MKYDVTFARYGFVTVEASSAEDAFRQVEGFGADDIEWSTDFSVTDAQKTE